MASPNEIELQNPEKETEGDLEGEIEGQEEIPEIHCGKLAEEGVFVDDPGSLLELGYGFSEDAGVLLPDVTALHLMQRGVLTVVDDGQDLVPSFLLNRGLETDPYFFLKYLVYRDMRSRGRKLRAGIGDMPYLWYYEKSGKPSSHLVAIYPRNRSIPLNDLRELVSAGGRLKKGVYLALVDEEGEVSYYEIKRFGPRTGAPLEVSRMDSAQLVGPMTVVWDTEAALSLYKQGYFGKPIGIRKPRSMDFSRPITLSFAESLYLAEKGRVKIEDNGGSIDPSELQKTAEGERNFRERMQVYRLLKDSGLVVKSGMKFGVDFAVYEYGPGLDHAPFLIHVFESDSSITPTEIVRAGRLAASVKKKFIVAQVDAQEGLVSMLSFARVKP